MEHTENENKAAGAPSTLNNELGHVPIERHHIKSEIWWLAERGSPPIYLGNESSLTTNVWAARRFPSFESAHEFVNSSMNYFGTDWRILDHMFYV